MYKTQEFLKLTLNIIPIICIFPEFVRLVFEKFLEMEFYVEN